MVNEFKSSYRINCPVCKKPHRIGECNIKIDADNEKSLKADARKTFAKLTSLDIEIKWRLKEVKIQTQKLRALEYRIIGYDVK